MDSPGPVDYDAELRLHDEVLRRACGVQSDEQVLDIGCGLGQTTCEAARLARTGSALGVDISESAIERARELARAQGVPNVTFERADAQVHRFPQERFDLAMSRFGTMFFQDPVVAFANVGRALRPAGRLVMMVWQASEHNEWEVAIRQSLAAVAPGGLEAFSLADPPTVTGSWRLRGSPTSPSPTSTSPSTTARTWPPRWIGSVASGAPATCSADWIPPLRYARSGGCARCSPRT